MTNAAFSIQSDGKLTKDTIEQIHTAMTPYLEEHDTISIVCSADVCENPNTIEGVEWKTLFDATVVEGIKIDYQYGSIPKETYGHSIMLIVSHTLPPNTLAALRNSDTVPVKSYRHFPYTSFVPERREAPEHPVVPKILFQ